MTSSIADRMTIKKSQSVPYLAPDTGIPYLGVRTPPVKETEWDYNTYFEDQIHIQHPEDETYSNDRRALHTLSTQNYLFGIPRIGFDIPACNIARTNPFFIMNEAIITDYLRQQEFNVVDTDGNRVDDIYEWFKHPNPQQSFWDIFIPMIRDVFAYDQGIIVCTFSRGGWIRELHAYRGPEFWAQLDSFKFTGTNSYIAPTPYLSHGYVTQWWQHAANGLFVPFQPEEVLHFMRYPQTGTVYGTDIMKYFRFHYRGLMSATVAYGKIMDNGLNAGIVFRHPDIGNIDTLQERLDGLKKVNQGATNFGKPLHLIGQEEVSTISANNLAGQQFIEGVSFNCYLIANVFGLPASEFGLSSGKGLDRMSSYNQKDIRKSRGIGTVLTMISEMINRSVLPRLKHYKKGMVFSFDEFADVDDRLKNTYVISQDVSSFKMLCPNAMFPPDIALKIVSFGKNLTPEEKDRIYDMVEEINYGDDQTRSRAGRYEGDDYQETFMGYKDISTVKNEVGNLRHPVGDPVGSKM